MSAVPSPTEPASGSFDWLPTDLDRQRAEALRSVPRPAVLDETKGGVYVEAPMERVLWRIIDANDALIVAGGHFGDEGKGKTVDAAAAHPRVEAIARVNSGENAGHTVYHNGEKFIFHLCPSGILLPRTNLIGPECVMDPITFLSIEIQPLIDAAVPYHDRLFVGNVHIVTPYHKLLDWLTQPHNSSTLRGIAPVHASKVSRRGLRLDHLFLGREEQRRRLAEDMKTFTAFLHSAEKESGLTIEQLVQRAEELNADGVIRMPQHCIEFLRAEDRIEYIIDLYEKYVSKNPAFPRRLDVSAQLREIVALGGKVLIEGPQSYWLSNRAEKFWESSTSADTSAAGLVAASGLNPAVTRFAVVNVHKYPGTSRVGIGACPASYVPQTFYSKKGLATLLQLPQNAFRDFASVASAYHAAVQPNGTVDTSVVYEDASGKYSVCAAMAMATAMAHGECGSTTKKPRVTGMFDCVAYHEVNSVQGPFLSISALDRGDSYPSLGVVVAYVYHRLDGESMSSNGRTYSNGTIIAPPQSLPCETVLHHCHPIVKVVAGWLDSPIAADKRARGAPLPAGVQDLIALIEHHTGAKVISIGNGPNPADIIYLEASPRFLPMSQLARAHHSHYVWGDRSASPKGSPGQRASQSALLRGS